MITTVKSLSGLVTYQRGLAATFLLAAACAHAIVAGSTPAQFSVSQSGAAIYSVPIEVPAGMQDLQPGLTLQYSSQAGQGIAGLGWSLLGASAIKRCGQTLAQDGKQTGVSLTASDRFCMNGRRLVLNGAASYGADGAVYYTEIDTFSKVTSSGVAGTGPKSFKVQTKSGLTLEFGNTDDSRMLPAPAAQGGTAPTTALMWSLNSVSDLSGNVIAYKYLLDTSNGSQRLERIEYNGGRAYIKFAYVPHSNPSTSFVAGTRVSHPDLLSGISTFVKDDKEKDVPVNTYQLAYEYKDVRGGFAENAMARLASVTECGANSDCRAPIQFSWTGWVSGEDRRFGFSSALFGLNDKTFSSSDGWGSEYKYPRRFADMDRDGHLDLIGFGSDGTYVSFLSGVGGGVSAAAKIKVSSEFGYSEWQDDDTGWRPRHIIDFNRDGYPDIVAFDNQQYNNGAGSAPHGMYIALWDPQEKKFKAKVRSEVGSFYTTGFGSPCDSLGGSGPDWTAPKYLLDMNKDGYADVIGFGKNGIYYSEGDGTTVGAAKLVSSQFRMRNTSDSGAPELWLTADCMGVNRQPIFMEDMNADGYPDVLAVGVNGTYLLLWDPVQKVFGSVSLVSGVFRSAFRNSDLYPTLIADMNGDGYPDLVGYRPDGVLISLWNGVSFSKEAYWTSEFKFPAGTDLSKTPRRIVDVNGDGYPDLINFANDGVYVAISNGNGKIYPAVRWTNSFPSNSTDSQGNAWGRDDTNTPRHVLDLDGDGTVDIIGFGSSSVVYSSANGSRSTRIHQITDSLGAKVLLRYSVAQPYSGFYQVEPVVGWPDQIAQGPMMVVANVFETLSGSEALTRKLRYRYGGLKRNALRGSLGFMWIAERDEPTGVENYREYKQTYPFIGGPGVEKTYKSSLAADAGADCDQYSIEGFCMNGRSVVQGQLLGSTVHNYVSEVLGNAAEYPANSRLFVYENKTAEDRWEIDGTQLPSKTTSYVYASKMVDNKTTQRGNLTQKSVVVDGGFSTVHDYTYGPADESVWNLGLLSEVKTTTTRPSRSVLVGAPVDTAPPPSAAPPKPIAPEVLAVILSILLDD